MGQIVGQIVAYAIIFLFWGWIAWLILKPAILGYKRGVKIAENENSSGFARDFESDILSDDKK